MHGSRFCSATSCARRCFLTVSGKYEPPLTVASLATITHSRPSTTPMPVTMPAPAACPSYTSQAASAPSSRNAPPGSTSRSIRSRASSFPRQRWRSTARSPPPRATSAVRSRSSATSCSIRSRRRANSSVRSTFDCRRAICGTLRGNPTVLYGADMCGAGHPEGVSRNRRLLLLAAALVVAAVVVGAVVAVRAGGGESSSGTTTRAKQPAAPAAASSSRALLGGIPQHGLTLGTATAPATLLEFVDPQCPYCAHWAEGSFPVVVRRFV